MARENSSGLGVNTRYGAVSLPDGARGEFGRNDGGVSFIAADFSADLINSDSINTAITVLPPYTKVLRAYVELETALSLSGAGAALSIGKQGSLGTDSCDLSGTTTAVGFHTLGQKGGFASTAAMTATTTVVVGMASGSINAGAGRFVLEVLKA